MEIVLLLVVVVASFMVGSAYGECKASDAIWMALNSQAHRMEVLNAQDSGHLALLLKKWRLM